MKKRYNINIFIILLFFSVNSQANFCQEYLYPSQTVLAPIEQWLKWERQESDPKFRQWHVTSDLYITSAPRDQIKINILPGYEDYLSQFLSNTNVVDFPWIKHPYNLDQTVLYSNSPNSSENYSAHHTASRSMVFVTDSNIGIKLPTDHPMGFEGDYQKVKTNVGDDALYALSRSELIEEIDARLGNKPRHVIILKEIATVIDKKTKNGYIFRDLSPLHDGHYYLPAHQIPHAGRDIALRHGIKYLDFWKQHWVEPLALAITEITLRYGLVPSVINPQNFLIQLNSDFLPTGVVVWRDIAESHLVPSIALNLGLKKYIQRDKQKGSFVSHSFKFPIIKTNLS